VTVRVFVTLLMLAQAMACPFLHCGECQGACAIRCVGADHEDGGCSEAESSDESHSHLPVSCETPGSIPNAPEFPDHDGSADCLCGGAIRTEQVKCPDTISFGLFLILPDAFYLGTRPPQTIEARSLACTGSVHFPPLITGRRVCILTQTWLL